MSKEPQEPPTMPDPPWRVLTTWLHNNEPKWRFASPQYMNNFRCIYGSSTLAKYLTVVPHPLNDPEAVAIITEAKNKP